MGYCASPPTFKKRNAMALRSGEQIGAGRRELHVGSGLMQFQPAPFNGELQAGLYSAGVPLSPNRNGPLIFST